jgi:bifunctional DNA-binding transcriptional regulator/antitoxin component of YhaV-PrlF toxin-antitoxin module
MTVVADNKKRVTIRLAKPGDRFDVEVAGNGKFVLTRLEPVTERRPAKVRIKKRGGYSVGVLGRPISEAAIKEALAEFP